MVLTASGEVLTNNHVIQGTTAITVRIAATGTQYQAHVVGEDPSADVALVQIDGASQLRTVTVGDSSMLNVGDNVTALGNALGQGGAPTAASGVVTGLNRTVTAADESGGAETLHGMIEISAAIQPGDSGGPVVDTSGRVVGMVTAGSQSGRFRMDAAGGDGFAVAINDAMAIVNDIEQGGGGSADIHIGPGPLLGVEVRSGGAGGALVAGVTRDGPAHAAGIAAGDLITAVAGHPIGSAADLKAVVQTLSAGQRVTVAWTSASGANRSTAVVLASGPPI